MGFEHRNQRVGKIGNRRCAEWKLPILAVFCALLIDLLCPFSAQAQTQPEQSYFQNSAFKIPFTVPSGARVYMARLYVSRDQGVTWKFVSEVRPEAQFFTYTSNEGEGSYWFAVQTINNDRTAVPPEIKGQNEGNVLRVVVDSRPPTVEVNLMHGSDGTARVDWRAYDDHLKPESLIVEYRIPPGNQWYQAYGVRKEATGSYTWNAGTQPIEVRVSVQDKAGNKGFALASSPLPGAPTTANPRPAYQAPNSEVRYVRGDEIRVSFTLTDVGKSGVQAVEVWRKAIPGGWEPQPRSFPVPAGTKVDPITIELKELKDGLYGYTLIAKSGVGLGLPAPRGDDPPQFLIRVDRTPPSVKIHDVVVGTGVNTGRVTITWEARDADNLMGKTCITISTSLQKDGPWTPLHNGKLDNIGQYIWPIPSNADPTLFFKVEAEDWAGNIGSDATAGPIVIEQNRPRVQGVQIEVPQAGPKGGPPDTTHR